MKRTAVVRTMAILFITVVALVTIFGIDTSAVADQGVSDSSQTSHGRTCSVASLHGTFGFTATGTVEGVGPIARVGLETFDGQGNASGTATTSVDGTTYPSTFTTTYTVNSDCTGTFTENDSAIGTAHDNIVIVDAGREIQAIGADSGEIITAGWRKQFPNADYDQ